MHCLTEFEMGLSPVKPDYRPAKETVLPPVMLMSRRAWCQETGPPRSREAFQSNPPVTNRRVILKFYLMHFKAPRMRASGKHSVVQFGRAV